jgi:hypothetical protein
MDFAFREYSIFAFLMKNCVPAEVRVVINGILKNLQELRRRDRKKFGRFSLQLLSHHGLAG